MISYRSGNDLNLDQVIALYVSSFLGAWQPVGEPGRVAAMLQHANLVITAWRCSIKNIPILIGPRQHPGNPKS